MRYHIETAPIWDAFKGGCDCPLCEIEENLSAKLVDQYLNEAVMEPAYRVEVNRLGFCPQHFIKLFDGKNKLGLTLQTQTRMRAVMEQIREPSPARAVKHADKLLAGLNTCVICGSISRVMNVYYETSARMFLYESGFKEVISASNGFCVKHYACLLKYAKDAGKRAGEFITVITETQTKGMEKLYGDMEAFTDKFDASKRGAALTLPTRDESAALHRSINKLLGKII